MYDVIVVGARCAGSPLAMLLAKKGYSVLAVDRATFPSDTMSTHLIVPDGVVRLMAWGLFDAVRASGCPYPISTTMTLGGTALPVAAASDAVTSICPRRYVLDTILVDAARDAGTEVREGFFFEGVLQDGGFVTGIRGRSRDGQSIEERARIVVGADGRHSPVAKAVGADEYNAVAGHTCGYYSYFRGVECTGTEAYVGDGQAMFLFPTNDGLTCIGMERPIGEFAAFRADIEGTMRAGWARVPGVAERILPGERVEKFIGSADLSGFYRKPYGPGWALAGDAGYYRDPVFGQGINDAFRDADMLSEAIDSGFSGRQPLDEALDAFEQDRNAATNMMYQLTNLLCSTLNPPPELAQMIQAGMSAGAPA
ncbi:MAG: NAD(P)/FAD-dependent oxidoreductase [Tepidiformaceae bacterium]